MSLMLRIGVAATEVQTGLARVEGMVTRFGGRLTGVLAGAVGVGAFGAVIKQSVEMAARLEDLSERFDAPIQGLQLLGNVAKEKGSDLESVGQAFKFLGKNAQLAAQQGTGELVNAFAAIGITSAELRTLRPDEIFLKLSDAFKAGRLTGQEFAVTAKLLGRGFEQLLPVLRLGSDEIRRIGESKGIFSEATVRQLAKVEDFLQKINNLTKVAAGEVTFGFIKSFQDFLKQGPAGSPAAALEKFLFGERKSPAGRRSGGSRITELNAGISEQEIKDQERRDREFVQFKVKMIDAEIEGREKAKQILQSYEEKTAQETIQNAEQRARATAEAISRIEDIRAQRGGPAAEEALLAQRARDAIGTANQTMSTQDILAAEQARQQFEQFAQRRIEQGDFFRVFGGDAQAQARALGDQLGNIPGLSAGLRDSANLNNMKQQQDGPKEATVQSINQKVDDAVKRLDDLIRASGTFGI